MATAPGKEWCKQQLTGRGYKLYLEWYSHYRCRRHYHFRWYRFRFYWQYRSNKGLFGTVYGLAIAGAAKPHSIKAEKGKHLSGREAMFGSYGLQRYTTQVSVGKEHPGWWITVTSRRMVIHGTINHTRILWISVGDFNVERKTNDYHHAGFSNSCDDERIGELYIDANELTMTTAAMLDYPWNAHSHVVTFRCRCGTQHAFTKTSASSEYPVQASEWCEQRRLDGCPRLTMAFGLSSPRNLILKQYFTSGLTGGKLKDRMLRGVGYGMKANPFWWLWTQHRHITWWTFIKTVLILTGQWLRRMFYTSKNNFLVYSMDTGPAAYLSLTAVSD